MKITSVQGRAFPIRGNDIDTDRIIPARFMKCVTFDGLGEYAFYDERFNEDGSEKDHPFNSEKFAGGKILVVEDNFGCGSSREHAPQALQKYGIEALIGVSFAEIFAGNCTSMGIPTITLKTNEIRQLLDMVEANPQLSITVLVEEQTVMAGDKTFFGKMATPAKNALMSGDWDTTQVLLGNMEAIEATAAKLSYMHG